MNENNNLVSLYEFKCELIPCELKKIDLSKCQAISISDIGKLGSLSIPVINVVQNVMGAGGSGLYMVNTAGGTLFSSAAKGGFIGGMKTATGGIAQSTLSPVIFNPITLGVALTMISTFIKLDRIENSCNKIYNYITIRDKAELANHYERLFKIYNEFRENFNNEKAVIGFIHAISDINGDAGNMIKTYNSLIEEELAKSTFNIDYKSVVGNAKELIYSLYYIKLALFNYAFSTMLSIFIEEKLNHETLIRCYEDIKCKKELIDNLTNKTKSYLSNECEKSFTYKDFLIKLFAKELTSKMPIKPFDKSFNNKVDEIINGQNYINNILSQGSELDTEIYNNNIKLVDKIFNEKVQILCDSNNFYIEN